MRSPLGRLCASFGFGGARAHSCLSWECPLPCALIPDEMSPSAIKVALRVLGLCAVLLLLAAAVTVSVAVLVWNSDAAHQWRECRTWVRNETARLAELEVETGILRERLQEGRRREEDLRRQLSQANHDRRQLNGTLASCWNHTDALRENVTTLKNATAALRTECTEAEARNEALQADLLRWQGQVLGTQRELEGVQQRCHNAIQNQRDMETQRDACRGRNAQLQSTVRDYTTEIENLRRQLSSGAADRRHQGPWQRVSLMATCCSLLFFTERLHS